MKTEPKDATKASFRINAVNPITGGFVLLCAITDENRKFYGNEDKIQNNQAPFVFTGQKAQILLRSLGIVSVKKLQKLVSLGATTITFDAYEGKTGEEYKTLKGEVRKYTQDGWNLLSGVVGLATAARAAVDAFIDKVEESVAIEVAKSEYYGMNANSTRVGTTAPVEEDIAL